MEALKKNKNSLLVLLLIIVCFVAYIFFFRDNGSLTNTSIQTEEDILRSEVVTKLKNLESLNKIDNSILKDVVFVSLKDGSLPIVAESSVGRGNPFAPIGTFSSLLQVIPAKTAL